MWWKWTAGADHLGATVDLCASDFDTYLDIYSTTEAVPTFTDLVHVSADDDGCGSLQSTLTFDVTPGTTYYFQIDGYSSAQGNIELSLTTTRISRWYVKENATGRGVSWNDPAPLQTALAGATAGDEIWVAAGTYYPVTPANAASVTTAERETSFVLVSGVEMYGGFLATCGTTAAATDCDGLDDRDWASNTTTLSGDIGVAGNNTDNSYTVVRGGDLTAATLLDGFTITGGNANGASSTYNRAGGLHLLPTQGGTSVPLLRNLVFANNTGSSTTQVFLDANIAGSGSTVSPHFENILLYSTDGSKHLMYADGRSGTTSSPVITNATFYVPSGTLTGWALYNNGAGGGTSNSVVRNSVFWADNASQVAIRDNNATTNVTHSLVYGVTNTANGNVNAAGITTADLFTDAANGDFSLAAFSPAIDAGSNAAVPADTGDADGDSDTAEAYPFDLAGNARFYDDTGVADGGAGTAPLVDIGAYEFNGTSVQNTAPSVTTNTGATLDEGAIVTLTTAMLETTDATDTADALTYTVTALPAHGELRADGTALPLNGTFTQEALDQGFIQYAHDGSDPSQNTEEGFYFTVADDDGASVNGAFAFFVTPTDDTPVTHYLLDGDAVDVSGNGNHGTVYGATPTADRFGNAGGALLFDGEDDYVQTPQNSNFKPLSFSVWFRADDISGQHALIDSDVALKFGHNLVIGYHNSDPGELAVMYHNYYHRSGFIVTAGQWYHAVVTYADEIKLYVDGAVVMTQPYTGTAFDGSNFRLGQHSGGAHPFTGAMDDVRFYDVELQPGDVAAIYGESPPTLAANTGLTLDEGATATLTTAHLQATDEVDGATGLRYTLTAAPENGTLYRFDDSAISSAVGSEATFDPEEEEEEEEEGPDDSPTRFDFIVGSTFTQRQIDRGEIRYEHDGGETTGDSFAFRVANTAGNTTPGTFAFDVTAVNDAPVITAPASVTIEEDGTHTFSGTVSVADADVGTNDLSVTLTATSTLTLGSTTGLVFTAGDGTDDETMTFTGNLTAVNAAFDGMVYTPTANNDQSGSVTITVNDGGATGSGGAQEESASVTIDITAVNDRPIVQPVAVTTDEDTAVNGTFDGSDVEGAALTYSIAPASLNGDGALTNNNDGTFSYDPDDAYEHLGTNEQAAITFGYFADDGSGAENAASEPATVTITINGVNDAPVVTTNAGLTLDEGASKTIATADLEATDPDDGAADLSFTLTSAPANGTLYRADGLAAAPTGPAIEVLPATLSIGDTFTQADIDAGRVSYQHDGGGTTADSFAFELRDPDGAGPDATFVFDITGVNDLPVGADDAYAVVAGATLTIGAIDGVLANDTDAENDPLTAVLDQDASAGTLSLNTDGGFTFTAPATAQAVTFTYVANDGTANAAAPATVTIIVEHNTDTDNIGDETEDAVPGFNGAAQGDGNGDGTPDRDQSNVASLPNAKTGEYVTVASPVGTALWAVHATRSPDAGNEPAGADFPVGFIAFEVEVAAPGDAALVEIYLPAGVTTNTWYKWSAAAGYAEFLYDGTTGAVILAPGAPGNPSATQTLVRLYLIDGGRGDADGIANGVIVDPSGPGLGDDPLAQADEAQTTPGTPVTINLVANDVAGADPIDPATVALTTPPDAAEGTVVNNGDGTVTFTPTAGFNGIARFGYTVKDTYAAPRTSDEVEVSVTVGLGIGLGSASGAIGHAVRVPVVLEHDPAGLGAISFELEIGYDPSVAAFAGVDVDGTLADGWNVSASAFTPGAASVFAANTTELGSAGTLVWLVFTPVAEAASSPLTLDYVMLNEDTPAAVSTTDGALTVAARLLGDAAGDGDGAITAYDAVAILEHLSGEAPFTGSALAAADVDGNGRITAYDAALVLQRAVDLIGCFPAEATCAPAAPPIGTLALATTDDGHTGDGSRVALTLTGGRDVYAAELMLRVDADDPAAFAERIELTGLPEGWHARHRFAEGTLRIAIAGPTPLADGTLAALVLPTRGSLRLDGTASLGAGEAQAVALAVAALPSAFALEPAYPNPFAAHATMNVSLPEAARVRLVVYDVLGREVARLMDGEVEAGVHEVRLGGAGLAAGTYLVRLETPTRAFTEKLVKLR